MTDEATPPLPVSADQPPKSDSTTDTMSPSPSEIASTANEASAQAASVNTAASRKAAQNFAVTSAPVRTGNVSVR